MSAARRQTVSTAWIPCAERLPAPMEDVIIAAYDPDAEHVCIVDIGFYSAKRCGWLLTGVAYITLDVRYWQPLPVGPKLQESTTEYIQMDKT